MTTRPVPLVGGLLLSSPTERREDQTWLHHYAERYPVTGGTVQFGVDLFERYAVPAWGGLARGVGELLDSMARRLRRRVLRDNRTYVDPLTGQTLVGDIKLIRDYRDHPASTFLNDLSVPLGFTGVRVVPVRALAGKAVRAIELSSRFGETTVRAGRRIINSRALKRTGWAWVTLANPTDPVIIIGNVGLGARRLATRVALGGSHLTVPTTGPMPQSRPLHQRILSTTIGTALLLTTTVPNDHDAIVTGHAHHVEAVLTADEQRRGAGRRANPRGETRSDGPEDLDGLILQLETGHVIEEHGWLLDDSERRYLLRQLRTIKAVRDEGLTSREVAATLNDEVPKKAIGNATIRILTGRSKSIAIGGARAGSPERIHAKGTRLGHPACPPCAGAGLRRAGVRHRSASRGGSTSLDAVEAPRGDVHRGLTAEQAGELYGSHSNPDTNTHAAALLRAAFQRGGLEALDTALSPWRWFNLSDVTTVRKRLKSTRKSDPTALAKWKALSLVGEQRMLVRDAADEVGVLPRRLRRWIDDFLSEEGSASAAWGTRRVDRTSSGDAASLWHAPESEARHRLETVAAELEAGHTIHSHLRNVTVKERPHARVQLRALTAVYIDGLSPAQAAQVASTSRFHVKEADVVRWVRNYRLRGFAAFSWWRHAARIPPRGRGAPAGASAVDTAIARAAPGTASTSWRA